MTIAGYQFDRTAPQGWTSRRVPVGERPPLTESSGSYIVNFRPA